MKLLPELSAMYTDMDHVERVGRANFVNAMLGEMNLCKVLEVLEIGFGSTHIPVDFSLPALNLLYSNLSEEEKINNVYFANWAMEEMGYRKEADILNGHIFVRQLSSNRRSSLAAAEVEEARAIVNVAGGSVNVAVGDGAVNLAVGAGAETAPVDRVSLNAGLINIALGNCIVRALLQEQPRSDNPMPLEALKTEALRLFSLSFEPHEVADLHFSEVLNGTVSLANSLGNMHGGNNQLMFVNNNFYFEG